MKNLILAVLMTCSLCAEIVQVEDMKAVFDALHDADGKTLVVFDVDMVLVQPSDPAFQMANMKRHGAIVKRIMSEVPQEKQMLFLSLMTLGSDPVLVDMRTPQFLLEIKARGIPAIALTANLTGRVGKIQRMEEWRVESLRQVGIDFSDGAPYRDPFVLDHLDTYRGNYSAYLNGVLLVNGKTVSKGDAFLAFLDHSGFMPNRVVFVDDRQENLQSLEEAIQKRDLSITYQGFHYLGALKYPSDNISEDELTWRWQKLVDQARLLD